MKVLFSLCWLGDEHRVKRNLAYLEYYRKLKTELGYDKIIFLDNASPMENLEKLGGTVVSTDGKVIMHDNPGSDLLILRFDEHLARTGIWQYPYCWRALEFVKTLIPRYELDKILFIDTDFYVLSSKLAEYIKNLDSGWVSFRCPKYGFPEAALHILCKDAFEHLNNFPIPSPTHYNDQGMEWLLPFTLVHEAGKPFKGGRYGEGTNPQTPDMDYYGQWHPGCPKMVYNLKE